MDTETTTNMAGQVLVNMVADNKPSYTNADYLQALATRKLQIKIGNPTEQEYMALISANLLPNCPITQDDIKAAEHIFGPMSVESRERLCTAMQGEDLFGAHT